MSIRRRAPWLLVLVAIVTVAGVLPAGAADPPTYRPQEELTASWSWRPCRGGECARLPVPLSYTAKRTRLIRIAVFRARAGSPMLRRGALLINPGGPGASGIDAARYLSSVLPASITRSFDIVGWDPRGTGASDSIDCGERLDYLFAPDTAPDTPAERTALEAASARFAKACARRSGDLIGHVSSRDTVEDMEEIRSALGVKRINYLGYSYGTLLGALYAQRYPQRVRTMVLDGAVDPTVPPEASLIQQAQGFDGALSRFFGWCDARPSCGYGDGDSSAAYHRLRDEVDAQPLRTRGRTFGPTQLDLGVASILYAGESGYRDLAQGLADLDGGDPAVLAQAADDYVGRRTNGTYDPSWGAFLAISCLDGPPLADAASMAAVSDRAAAAAPEFGASSAGLGTPCVSWPVGPVFDAPQAIAAPDAPPIVVIGTRNDPVTPLAWAQGLATQLGVGRLLIGPGAQHTSFPQGDRCLDPKVTKYILTGRPPADGATCG